MDPPPVWVPGEFVRRFFSCEDAFDGELENDVTEDVMKTSERLCAHNGLHPREARRGKLLSSVTYETIIQSLFEERTALLAKTGTGNALENQDRSVVTPSENMFCQECVDDFLLNMRPKVELLEDYLFLFEELDTKSEDAPHLYNPGTKFSRNEEKYVYLVTRKFCTTLRDFVKQIMKKVAPADNESNQVDEKLSPLYECIGEGIEVLDVKKDLEIMSKSGENGNGSIDTYVNGAITCMLTLQFSYRFEPYHYSSIFLTSFCFPGPHGQCTRVTKQSVRYVSWKVWSVILKLFPHAIEHRQPRRSSDDIEVVDIAEECLQCEEKESLVDNLSKELCMHAKACSTIADDMEGDPDDVILCDDDENFHAIHVADAKSFKKFVSTFRRKLTKSEPDSLRQEVLNCLAPNEDIAHLSRFSPETEEAQTLDEIDRRTLELTSKFFRTLKCLKHRLPISSGLTVAPSKNGSTVPHPKLSTKFVCLINDSTYRKYMTSICALARILISSEEGVPSGFAVEYEASLQMMDDFCSRHGVFEWHPTLRQGGRPGRTVILESGKWCMKFYWPGDLCCDGNCLSELNVLYPPLPERSGISNKITGNGEKSAFGTDAHPIMIDVDSDDGTTNVDTFPLLVFEAEESAPDESILQGISQCTGVASPLDDDTSGLRRSSRRRKTRMPLGVLQSEETVQADMCQNIAALRLRLFEACKDFQLNHRLLLLVTKVDTKADADPRNAKRSTTIPLDFSLNQKTLVEICGDALDKDFGSFVPKDSLLLIRQAVVEESARSISKESLMDDLISLSNISNEKGKKRKKERTVERGFTGTLLSSGLSTAKRSRGNEDGAEPMAVDPPKDAELSTCTAMVLVDNSNVPKGSPLDQKLVSPARESLEGSSSSDQMEMDSPREANGDIRKSMSPLNDSNEAASNLAFGISDLLKETSYFDPKHKKQVWTASTWAAENNPGENRPEKLVDTALAKYLELTMD